MNALSDPCARIFLLSYMSAFTSLAGHILGSHPQVNGYQEMYLGYEDAAAGSAAGGVQTRRFGYGGRALMNK
jgi:hypothetical protein